MSCTCFLGNAPCGYCEDSWECEGCGRSCNPEDDTGDECSDCGRDKWFEDPVEPERPSLFFKGQRVPLTILPPLDTP